MLISAKGDVTLAEQVIGNRQRQDELRRDDPTHAVRAFGEHVEPASSSAGCVPQDLVHKACERVLPAVTRALADAFSNKIDDMVQQWQRQATQQVEATLQDSTKHYNS